MATRYPHARSLMTWLLYCPSRKPEIRGEITCLSMNFFAALVLQDLTAHKKPDRGGISAPRSISTSSSFFDSIAVWNARSRQSRSLMDGSKDRTSCTFSCRTADTNCTFLSISGSEFESDVPSAVHGPTSLIAESVLTSWPTQVNPLAMRSFASWISPHLRIFRSNLEGQCERSPVRSSISCSEGRRQ